MTAPPRRVPARYFSLLLDALKGQGVDTQRLLAIAGIDAARFRCADAMLARAEVDAFISAAQRLSGRSDLGFEFGRLIQLNSHDLLGYGMLSCPNLHHLLVLTSRHYHHINEMFAMRYRRYREGGEVAFTPVIAMEPRTMHFCMEAIALSVHTQFRLLFGTELSAYDIRLAMPPPQHHERYASLAPARFRFDEASMPGIVLQVDAAMLDKPLPMAAPHVVEQVEQRMQTRPRRPVADTGWGECVEMLLRQSQGRQITLEDIARRIDVSARTIDRGLKKEGLRFRALSQRVRFERARELLAIHGASVSWVADQLGFTDAANFSRGFRRHCGVTPSEFLRAVDRRSV